METHKILDDIDLLMNFVPIFYYLTMEKITETVAWFLVENLRYNFCFASDFYFNQMFNK
jgi:hypothetical protein